MKDADSLDSAEQRLIHGLLADVYERSGEARVRLAMRELAPPRPAFFWKVAAILTFAAGGIVLGSFFQSRLPEADGVIEKASREANDGKDRQYRATIVALKSPADERLASGTVHVRSQSFAVEFESVFGRGWLGTDGSTAWYIPRQGAAQQWPNHEPSRWIERQKLGGYVQFAALLRGIGQHYDLVTLGREDGHLRVRATRKLPLSGLPVSQLEVWVAAGTGVMKKLQYRVEPEIWHWEPWLVTVELAGETPHPPDFYSFETRLRERPPPRNP